MPAPLPIDLASIGQVSPDLFECIMCRPAGEGLDSQRYRGAGDSKRLYMRQFYPFRMLSFADQSAWDEYDSHPDVYWNRMAWGSYGNLYWDGATWNMTDISGQWQNGILPSWSNQGPVIFYQWLASAALVGANGDTAGHNNVMQVLSMFDSPRDYQIWQVTVRLPFLSYDVSYTGFFPPNSIPTIWFSDPPWWASSDFAQVGSGTLLPKHHVTIQPNGAKNLKTVCQIPPAGCLSDGVTPSSANSDWLGWGLLTYLVWV